MNKKPHLIDVQPISKIQAYRQLQKARDFSDIESIRTHTMRKTFGYWFYKQTKDVSHVARNIESQHTTSYTQVY